MSTPHDPWSTGPTASDDSSARADQPPAKDPVSDGGAPDRTTPVDGPDDRTVTRASDGTYTRPGWPGAGDGTPDPNATQVRPAQARAGDGGSSGSAPIAAAPGASAWSPPVGPAAANPPAYGQPGYQQPSYPQPTETGSGYGQPTGSTGYQGQPGYDPTYGPQSAGQNGPPAFGQPGYAPSTGGYAPSPGGYPASPPTQKKPAGRRPLIIGLCAELVLALATVGFLVLRSSSSPAFTFAGKKISNADTVLASAQSTTATLVTSRHGASNSDTRCYFARAKTPARGTKKSDIDANVYCGPVLFVDGDASKTYLSYPLTQSGTKGKAVTLAAGATPTSSNPQSAPADKVLGRPDKATAKTSSLALPTPPPAAANIFSTTADVTGQTLKAAPTSAVIGSRTGGVKITTLGTIARYGHGDDARSAPAGQKLIAFKTTAGPDEDADDHFPFGTITVAANGQTHTVPKSAATVVVAVPTAATAADLVVNDSGVTQKISLLTGRPAATNIAVGRRLHRDGPAGGSKDITFTISDGGDRVTRQARATLLGSDLRYWVRVGDERHAASPGSALLYLNLEYSYTEPLKSPFTGGGSFGPYGFSTQLLTLHLPNGQVIEARNYATSANKVYLLFTVTPTFTFGRVVITGSAGANKHGVVFGIVGAPYFDVSIPAG